MQEIALVWEIVLEVEIGPELATGLVLATAQAEVTGPVSVTDRGSVIDLGVATARTSVIDPESAIVLEVVIGPVSATDQINPIDLPADLMEIGYATTSVTGTATCLLLSGGGGIPAVGIGVPVTTIGVFGGAPPLGRPSMYS